MKFQVLGAVIALSLAGAANAADLTPTEIVNRHVTSGGNVDAIMADYADDAVVLQQGRAFQGKEAIRGLFENMFKRPAGGAAPSAPPSGAGNGSPPKMNVTKVWEEGDVGFMTWEMGPMKATEEFIVRDGKIQVQTIFMSGPPAGAPASH